MNAEAEEGEKVENEVASIAVTDIPQLMQRIEEITGISLNPLTDYIITNLNQSMIIEKLIHCLDNT